MDGPAAGRALRKKSDTSSSGAKFRKFRESGRRVKARPNKSGAWDLGTEQGGGKDQPAGLEKRRQKQPVSAAR
jgi:hypothetical protein